MTRLAYFWHWRVLYFIRKYILRKPFSEVSDTFTLTVTQGEPPNEQT